MMHMVVPQGLSYVNFQRMDTDPRKDIPILCSAPTPSTNNTLKCDIGNPLPTYATAKFRVFFQPRYGSEVKSSYEFYVTLNSTNPEEIYAKGDNAKLISLPIRVQTDMKVFGVSNPQPVRYNASQWQREEEFKSEAEIGPEVFHIYEIKCQGPSNIESAEVTILWPSYLHEEQHFLYLLEQPFVDGPGECDPVEDVNPLALTIIQRRGKWDSLIVRDENRVTSVFDTEESLIHGEGRRGAAGSVLTGSGTSTFGGGAGYSNTSSHKESHSERKTVSSGGYSRSYNYSRTHTSYGETSGSSSTDEYKVSSIFPLSLENAPERLHLP